jgi:hypothetical protein
MAARLAPYDEPNTGSRRTPECHRWAGFGFHLTASAVSATTRRLITRPFGERFAFRFGSDHVANFSQHLNPRRERVAIIIDDPPKFPFESVSLFVGKFKIHTLDMGLTPIRRGVPPMWADNFMDRPPNGFLIG